MRTIKFRAWDKKEKRMFKVYGLTWHWGIFLVEEDGRSQRYGSGEVNLMQFTGLLDKNGKEIYEGDIMDTEGNTNVLYAHYFRMVIRWDEKLCGFCAETNGNAGKISIGDTHGIASQGKVIGNIHENPELLIASSK